MKYIRTLVLLLPVLLFTSCFEVIEDVSVNKNGTGQAKLTINLSQSKSNIANFMNIGEYQGRKLPSVADIQSALDKVQNSLVAAQGISDVDVLSNYTDYIFEIVCDFDNVQLLNKAINKVADDMNESAMPTVKLDNFAKSDKSFKRLFKYPINLPNYDELPTIFQFMMETANFTGIYRFEEEVSASSNSNTQISPSGKAVKMQSNLKALITKEKSIATEISFK